MPSSLSNPVETVQTAKINFAVPVFKLLIEKTGRKRELDGMVTCNITADRL